MGEDGRGRQQAGRNRVAEEARTRTERRRRTRKGPRRTILRQPRGRTRTVQRRKNEGRERPEHRDGESQKMNTKKPRAHSHPLGVGGKNGRPGLLVKCPPHPALSVLTVGGKWKNIKKIIGQIVFLASV